MKYLILILLLATAIFMIYLGVKADMLPPTLTGIGFILIGILFLMHKKR